MSSGKSEHWLASGGGARLAAMCLAMWLVACDSDKVASPSPTAAKANTTSHQTQSPAQGEPNAVVAIRRADDTGFLSLRIDEAALAREGDPVHVQVRVACRYVSARGEWQRLPASPTRIAYRMEPRSTFDASAAERTLYELPKEPGLFWVLWIEEREKGGAKQPAREWQQTVNSGAAQCASASNARSVDGRVNACVVLDGRAAIQSIADPADRRSTRLNSSH